MIEFKHDPDCFFTALDFSAWSKVLVLMDTNTQRHCYDLIRDQLPEHHLFAWEPGEANKNISTCMAAWEAMTHARLDRSSLVINLGGGVTCDMGGFCAATFKRGVSFIHCPTSLLAQVDAGVGGKLGVDFQGFKNQIGVFQEPVHVFIASAFLETLPVEELRSGHAEMIKHSLLSGGEDWEKQKSANPSVVPALECIEASVKFKQRVVQRDSMELGARKVLNFGHTIGHALEGVFLAKKGLTPSHGHAVAVGMICELFLSRDHAGLPESEMISAQEYIQGNYPPMDLRTVDRDSFFKALVQDKKSRAGQIRTSLLKTIGQCVVDVHVTPESCWDTLKLTRNLVNG